MIFTTITNERVKECPRFDAIYDDSPKILSGRLSSLTTPKFDRGMLAQTCSNKFPVIKL